MEHKCNYCNVSFKRNCELVRHSTSIKCKNNKNNINMNNKLVELENNLLEIKNLKQQLDQALRENKEEKQKVFSLEIKLNDSINKSEEYRKIIEKYTTKNNFKLQKENDTTDNTFQIDINLNNK
jgi:hypothetical protein